MKLLAALLLSTAVWIAPLPAQAATPGCVDHNEFAAAPWTDRSHLQAYWQVGNGRSPGTTTWGNPNLYNVDYPACAGDGYFVSVGYRKTTNQAIGMVGFFPKRASRSH